MVSRRLVPRMPTILRSAQGSHSQLRGGGAPPGARAITLGERGLGLCPVFLGLTRHTRRSLTR